ncbi:MAG: hypothetical protein ACXWDN_14455 [Limisphaerales bacterium]
MKNLLLLATVLVSWNISAQSIVFETPIYDGVVIVTGAEPAPQPCLIAPVVYDTPVVYNAPVQYNAPVVYTAPVVYNNISPAPETCGNDFGGMTIKVYPRRNCYARCNSNVTIIGRGSALIR